MYNFDALTLKLFALENEAFLEGAFVQKIQQPSRSELIFSLRNKGVSKKLYVNLSADLAHICFLNSNFYKIPKSPPMFCMLLRKYLENARIIEAKSIEYERIFEIYFEKTSDFKDKTVLCLAIEIMGKYSNMILYDTKDKVILGCAHNVSSKKSSVRELFGGIKYLYPPRQNKKDILKTSYGAFLDSIDKTNLIDSINANYFYFTKPMLELLYTEDLPELFYALQKTASLKNFDLLIKMFGKGDNINEIIEKYYSGILIESIIQKKKVQLEKIIQKEIKKCLKTLEVQNREDKMLDYKRKGDIILANLHKIKSGDEKFRENGFEILLDKNKTANENAQKYFNLYKKYKNAKEIELARKNEALQKEKELREISFSLQSATTLREIEEIEELFLKNDSLPLKSIKIEKQIFHGWEYYMGKNALQNSFLLSKIARSEDFWFHAKDCPSAYLILKNPNKGNVPNDILLFCAEKIKENSTAKNSGKTAIIYTRKKYLKKAQNSKTGLVLYENEKEIIV